MKVLLINSNLLKPPITPLGLAYLSSAVRNAGHDAAILDLNFSEDIRGDISKTISGFSPDVIGISIRNIDNATMLHSVYFIPTIKEIVTLCKEFTDAPIVLGGPGFSMMPAEILKELDVPYGIVGEGEIAFPDMLSCLNNGGEISKIGGAVYRSGDRVIKNRIKNIPSKELNSRPLPDRELLDNRRYLNDGGMGNIQTKRGCDRRCIYCTYPIIEGRKLRFRYPKNVADELEILINKMGIDYLHFSDSTFNIPNEHAIAVCKEMVKRGIRVKWTPYMSPFLPSEELFTLVKKTGCDGIVFGADSVSETMLGNLEKEFSVSDINMASLICKELEIPFSLNLLFGGPGETKETVMETLDNLDRMKPIAVGAMIGVRCYANTKMAKIAREQKFYKKDDNLLRPLYYVSPTVDRDWLIDTIQQYANSHENFFIPTSKKGLHTDNLIVEIFRDGIRGPFWEIYKEFRKRAAAQKYNV
ncbi:MAG: cobalamin B12-binding domain-containing protein [Nitrospinae bacterium]|nr:cobalamin B12-binding domain-containing protein [Nitrospinota bacterium]